MPSTDHALLLLLLIGLLSGEYRLLLKSDFKMRDRLYRENVQCSSVIFLFVCDCCCYYFLVLGLLVYHLVSADI